jgi:protein-tyrosine phosphatase
MTKPALIKILFVCMGNICRSPTAQGIFEAKLRDEGFDDRVIVDSAGTHSYHVGAPPDPRSIAAALKRGIDLSALRARQVHPDDFYEFDLVLAMDRANLGILERISPRDKRNRLEMFLEFAPGLGIDEVPDPYNGIGNGFERVLDIVEAGSDGLLAQLHTRYDLNSG